LIHLNQEIQLLTGLIEILSKIGLLLSMKGKKYPGSIIEAAGTKSRKG
jgi:hypothetical protein|tara:strand:- start:320 stop:463 length:144 start_codon:yes stop_codon:yes gene_type:complete